MRAFGSRRKQATVADAPPQPGVIGFSDTLTSVADDQDLTNRTPVGKGSYGSTSGRPSLVTRVTTSEFICPKVQYSLHGNALIPEPGSEWSDHIGVECGSFASSTSVVHSAFFVTTLHGAAAEDSPLAMFSRVNTAEGVSRILVQLEEDGGSLNTVFQLDGITKDLVQLRYEQKVLSDSQIRIAVEWDEVLVMPPETFAFNSAGRSTRVTIRQTSAVTSTRRRLYRRSASGSLTVDSIPTLIL